MNTKNTISDAHQKNPPKKRTIYNEAKIKRSINDGVRRIVKALEMIPTEKKKIMSFIKAMINCRSAKYRQNS